MSDDLEAHRLSKANPTWSPIKLKFLCSLVGGGTPSKDREDFWTGGDVPWVSPKDMKVRDITDTEDHITLEAVAQSATSFVPSGAPIIVARSGILRHTIPVAISRTLVTLNQDMKAFRVSSKLDPEFLAFWIEGQSKDLLLEWRQFGATVESLDTFRLLNGRLALPDLPTQKRIAAFLDRETARIDDLIAKKERLVEVLVEKRSSALEHLVSASGGQVTALRRILVKIEQGWSPECEARMVEGDEWGVLKVGCVNDWQFKPEEHKALPEYLSPRPDLEISNGDILMSRANTPDLVGSVSMVQNAPTRLMLCDKLYRLKFNESLVVPAFAVMFLRSRKARDHYASCSTGASSSMQNISQEIVRSLQIPLPSTEEQERRVEKFEALKVLLGDTIRKTKSSIDRLREYRAALITAAVTGQIDVETYGESGTPSATLDQIEEEMQG